MSEALNIFLPVI